MSILNMLYRYIIFSVKNIRLLLVLSFFLFTYVKTSGSVSFDQVTIDGSMSGDCKMMGDIDGDGYSDLVVGGMAGSENLQWYRYPDWSRTEIAVASNEFTTDGKLGDVDGDGDLDVIVPDGDGTNNLLWFENPLPDGDVFTGSDWTKHVIGTVGGWGKDIQPADYDHNGFLDVATRSNEEAMIFFQTAANNWSKKMIPVSSLGDEGMSSGDIDQDGYVDIVVKGAWLRNPGGTDAQTGSNWDEFTIGLANDDFKALVADINNDNIMDVLFSSSENTADVDWWTPADGDPTGSWTKTTIVSMLERCHTLQAADMDNDGDTDVVLAQMHTSSDKAVMVYYNEDGQGKSWLKQILATTGLHNGVVGDIGSDGDYDIFGCNWTGNPPLRLWENQSNPKAYLYKYFDVTENHQQTFGLAFGDVNHDGLADIISGIYWYKNPGGDMMGSWLQHSLPDGMQAFLYVDIDDDGFTDIIAQKQESALSLYWLEAQNSEGTSWNSLKIGEVPSASHTLGAQGYGYAQLEAGDKPEIVIASGNGIYYFKIPENPDTDNWSRIHINANPSDEGIGIGDIDNDGALDVASGTGESKRVEWYRNPGDGSSDWTAYHIGDFSEAVWPDRCVISDLNGDKRPDIIMTEENDGATEDAETYWWEQPLDATAGDWIRHLLVTQATTNSMDAADIDGDGDTDLITGEHRGQERVIIWDNDGEGIFTGHEVDSGKESHLGTRLYDLDSDGDLDIISIAWDDYQNIHLWINEVITEIPSVVSAPEFNPNGGVFSDSVRVDITTKTEEANIYFTIDNSVPTVESSQFISSVKLTENTSIKARAFKNGYEPSPVSTAFFTILKGSQDSVVSAPEFNPNGGVFNDSILVDIMTKTEGANIYFTTDNSVPTVESSPFIGSLKLTESTSIRARAFKDDYEPSPVSTASFTILKGPQDRVYNGIQVLYTFDEGTGNNINDVSGVDTPLNLTFDTSTDISWGDGFLSITGDEIVQSISAATKIVNSCLKTNQITIEAWIKTNEINQSGPARIVTLSADAYNRNFTLGQEVGNYDVRLRTTETGNNGSNPSLTSEGSVKSELTHIIYEKDSLNEAKIYINGVINATGEIEGYFSNWDAEYFFALGNEISGSRPWHGDFYLVAIYNRALTESEISQNYSAGPEEGNIDVIKHIHPYQYFPEDFELYQNFPNPFNRSTIIKFRIFNSQVINLIIFNLNGKVIDRPLTKYLNPGEYSIQWNAGKYASGIYYYSIGSGSKTITKKMIFLK